MTPEHADRLDSTNVNSTNAHHAQGVAALSLAALGVVFGDIGTSPIYAFHALFSSEEGISLPVDEPHIFGALSLVLWSVTFIVSIKYLGVLLRADNDGEGGELSLTALISSVLRRTGNKRLLTVVIGLGMCAAGLFYGDSLITPAISILSAVEGLEKISPTLDQFVVPIALALVIILFLIQRWGTGVVGRAFGPIMGLWFITIAALGVASIVKTPEVLVALSPHWAFMFIIHEPLLAFLALGAVVLTVTGAEALYADMGHFGRPPIARAWFIVVFPCLAMNYLGQGALVLRNPKAGSPFFDLVPENLRVPVVILATMATIIASQAVIAGAFSVSMQAQRMGLLPRLTHTYTSDHKGQIYVPDINWILCIGAVTLILVFQSSQGLSHAYGIAVSGSFVLSTCLLAIYLRVVKEWSLWKVIPVIGAFGTFELCLLGANLPKVVSGGWIPLVISSLVICIMVVWRRGAERLRARRSEVGGTWAEYQEKGIEDTLADLPGTIVYLHQDLMTPPLAFLTHIRVNKAIHENVIIAEVHIESVPKVLLKQRLELIEVPEAPDHVTFVRIHFGFKEHLDVPRALRKLAKMDLECEPWTVQQLKAACYITARSNLVFVRAGFLTLMSRKLFRVMFRNQARASDLFHLPVSRTMGVETDLRF